MNNSGKILVLFFLGTFSFVYAMQQSDLQNALVDLQEDLTVLENRLQPAAQGVGVQRQCPGGICPRRWGKGRHGRLKGAHHRHGHGVRHHHNQKVKSDFAQLLIKTGLAVPAPEAIQGRHRGPHRRGHHHGKGRRGHHKGGDNREQINNARDELNTLLSESVLTAGDIVTIEQKINALEALNPRRWPRAADYKAVLERKK